MENPASWNEVEQAIHEAIAKYDVGVREGKVGFSMVRLIYLKLWEKGLLQEKHSS